MPAVLVLSCIAALLATGALAVPWARRPHGAGAIYGACLAACLIVMAIALGQLTLGGFAPATATLPLGLPWIGARFRLDALAAFFLFVVNLCGAAASLYGIGYGRRERTAGPVLPFYPAFLAGMNLVVLADDAFTFLFAWEFMSLASWALVLAQHREAENARAGYVYLVMASFGTFCLLLAMGLLAGRDGGYAFAAMRADRLDGPLAGLALALALLGAGSKAGLVPLHVWLPLAHPAAPSHVSALMSGAMTKVAVYGFARIVFDLLGPPEWWWSMPVMALGGATAALGVLYALMQTDLKRLLAYSTVENVGIVFIGLGLALAFEANGMALAAALALGAGLLHALNHALFKSLLFMGAGAVLASTGLRDLERMGGLIGRMPVTAFAFLAGAVSIAALPPMNGFVSEWLTFQALLLSPALPQWGLKLLAPAVASLLALAAALSAACFVRAFGVAFLGRPRGEAAARASEADALSRAAMLALAGLCLLLGLAPGPALDALAPVLDGLVGERLSPQAGRPWLMLAPVAQERASYNGLLVFLFMAASELAAAWAIHRFASRAVRRAPAWDCGFPDASPATQYTAGSFAQPIRRVYGGLVFLAREQVEMPPPGAIGPARFSLRLRDLAWEGVYDPLARAVTVASGRLNAAQFLTVRRYLSLVFLALVGLLAGLAIWR
jgi:hydrogenase-4 component B